MEEVNGEIETKGVAPNVLCDRFSDEGWTRTSVNVPVEMDLKLYVNGKELVTILCTPVKLNCLVLGFLYAEEVISGTDDVATMRVCEEESLADVKLVNQDYIMPALRTLTSGCGGGISFKATEMKVESNLTVAPAQVFSLMKLFQEKMELYQLSGGIHASALFDSGKLTVLAEDIGRHNTLDKIAGECLLRKVSSRDGVLLSTGRVSSEMLLKVAKMQVPIVVSRTSPTERAILLARELGVALVGYARGSRLSVYSHPERLGHTT